MTDRRESFDEQLSRVEQMAEDEGCAWDLSDNDQAALRAVLVDRQRMAAKLNDPPGEPDAADLLTALVDLVREIVKDGDLMEFIQTHMPWPFSDVSRYDAEGLETARDISRRIGPLLLAEFDQIIVTARDCKRRTYPKPRPLSKSTGDGASR